MQNRAYYQGYGTQFQHPQQQPETQTQHLQQVYPGHYYQNPPYVQPVSEEYFRQPPTAPLPPPEPVVHIQTQPRVIVVEQENPCGCLSFCCNCIGRLFASLCYTIAIIVFIVFIAIVLIVYFVKFHKRH